MTGLFKEITLFMMLIIVHECGHVLAALFFGWKLKKIVILPFGGMTIFEEHLNRPRKEEVIILLLGPLFQIGFYFLCELLFFMPYQFANYHYAIFLFNLLPLVPLDGSKLVNLLFSYLVSFSSSHLFMLVVATLTMILVIPCIVIYNISFVFYLILCILLVHLFWEYKSHQTLVSKFQLERYLYSFSFRKRKRIKGMRLHKMKRDHKHLFLKGNKTYTEAELLRKKFDFK